MASETKPSISDMPPHIQNIVADFDRALTMRAQAHSIGASMGAIQHTGQEFGGSQAVASVLDNSTSHTV